jgi:type VI secretion system protein ImpB
MGGSFQNEIPPARINIKLDVGKGNAKKKIELPLKMLVMGDFSFKQRDDRIADREKISINKENFKEIMENMNLKLKYSVENKITGGGDLAVDMDVKSLDSLKPENVAKNIPALSKMLAARNLLKDLKSNLLDNREFRKRLEGIIKDPTAVKSLQEELKKIVPEAEPEKQ